MLETTKIAESERAEHKCYKVTGLVTHAWFQMRGIQLRRPLVSTSQPWHRQIFREFSLKLDHV